jgi:hypothetical protein
MDDGTKITDGQVSIFAIVKDNILRKDAKND